MISGMTWMRSSRVAVVALLFATVVGLAGGGNRATAQDDAAGMLEEAVRAMAALSSFHFELSTPRGQTLVIQQLELIRLEGDVQRPDRFRGTIEARAAVIELSVDVVGIGTQLWVSDPSSEEGGYFELEIPSVGGEQFASPADFINPDRILLRAVDLIEEPSLGGEDEIDGVAVTRIDGVFDPASVTGGGEGTATASLAGQPLPLAIWIDDEFRVRRLEVAGPFIASEAPDVVRRLDLSAFDEPVEIIAPVT